MLHIFSIFFLILNLVFFFVQLWEETIKPLNALNAGISGDRTEHVLWRLQNGLLKHATPKVRKFCLV